MTDLSSPLACEDYGLSALFADDSSVGQWEQLRTTTTERLVMRQPTKLERTLDLFSGTEASCCFLRFSAGQARDVRIALGGSYSLTACAFGGWLLHPSEGNDDAYWLPLAATLRRLDEHSHVLDERAAVFADVTVSAVELALRIRIPDGWALDWVIWRITCDHQELLSALIHPSTIEMQPIFLWGSHTCYGKPSDLYSHLINGHVYENRFSWPHRRKICSENDAHALYVALSGLERATGKHLYRLLKRQVVLSVLARQGKDGGWHHGEWSDQMEAHFRFNASAIHLLMDAFEETKDEAIQAALARAVAYISRQRDELQVGTWFLHDELELSEAGMNQAPFRWQKTRALGKSVSNMLVLNTHLDTTIALDRYGALSGDQAYETLVASARAAARAVLALRPAEWLYRAMFRAITLTFLPSTQAAQLPLVVRAVKRLAWKYLIPNLYRVKSRYPRFVMPGGYIDRAIPLKSWAFHYLSVNLMDLLRYQRRFPRDGAQEAIRAAIDFTHRSGVLGRWAELSYERYALGFWAEALYHACTLYDEARYRQLLAEAVLLLEDQGMGIPPSLMGANCEAVPREQQQPCLVPETDLRVVNLSRNGCREYLVVNATATALPTRFATGASGLVWFGSSGERLAAEEPLVEARTWIRGKC